MRLVGRSARGGSHGLCRYLLVCLLLLAVVGIASASAQAAPLTTEGTDFWLGLPTNFFSTAPDTLYITGYTATTGTVSIPGLGFTRPFGVTPGVVSAVQLPAGAEVSYGTTNGTQDKGIHVTSALPVVVYGFSDEPYSTDGYTSFPVGSLGTGYRILAFGNGTFPGTELDDFKSEFSVVATRNETTVTITPSVDGGAGHAHLAGTPYTVTLNEGEEYQLQATTDPQDLSGTTITATAPVSVFAGQQCADVPTSSYFACDYMIEQMPPESSWGTAFLSEPLKTRSGGDEFELVAQQNATEVKLNGSALVTLNAGEHYAQEVTGASEFTANKPIMLAQYANGGTYDSTLADPFMMTVPPESQYATSFLVASPKDRHNHFTNYLNLIVPKAEVGTVQVNGSAVPAGEYHAIGTSGYYGAQVTAAAGSASNSITGNGQAFMAFAYGFAEADGYGYPAGTATPSTPQPHWYSDGQLIPEGQVEPVATKGTLTIDFPGAPVQCGVSDEENIVNPVGGGSGTDEITAFTLLGCTGKPSHCPAKTLEVILPHPPPWATKLIGTNPVTDEIAPITFELRCTGGPILATITPTLAPVVGTSTLQFHGPSVFGNDALKGPPGDTTITAETFSAPHWYSNGKRIEEGQVEPVATSGTLSFTVRTFIPPEVEVNATVKCKLSDEENIVNPIGGGSGTDEFTAFTLSACKAKPAPCPGGSVEALALGLPWRTELLWAPMVDEIPGFSLQVRCSNGGVLRTITEALEPGVGDSVLEFTGGEATGSDKLKGPPGDQKITAEDP